ncbi:HAD family hydrolase [Marinitoga aeolica]|uniref:Beta-phosphoglucomutase n=1 Tax=Marinitoga aeolica TaxID=2809031 RepID=A0ABY8PRD3_9BACT|nr:beta-phosphoglucomutase family hydrolase [Marinitoga aeolica]WGS65078.1 beta-phosphoglucomutase family hydrolase [Marinitoga aeolica]
MLEAVIFDMDGVITDTVPLHYNAWKKMFEKHGYYFDFNVYKEKVDGKPRMKGISSVATNVDEKTLNQMAEEKQNYFLEYIEKTPPEIFQDTWNFIKELKKYKIKIAVASSSKNTKKILESLKIYDVFDTVVTGYDFIHGKPNPEIFLIAANRLNVSPENCIVIEDAIEGINAGINAKMFTIGIARHGNNKELSHANLVVKSLNEIKLDNLISIFQEAKK